MLSLGNLVATGKPFQEGCEISDHKGQLLILPDGFLCDVAIGPPHLLRWLLTFSVDTRGPRRSWEIPGATVLLEGR